MCTLIKQRKKKKDFVKKCYIKDHRKETDTTMTNAKITNISNILNNLNKILKICKIALALLTCSNISKVLFNSKDQTESV